MKVFGNSIFQKYYGYFFFIILCLSLFIGLFFNEDASGGGTSKDFFMTWIYVEELKKNIFLNPSKWTVHFPLHYILLSKLNIFINNKVLIDVKAYKSNDRGWILGQRSGVDVPKSDLAENTNEINIILKDILSHYP